MKNALFLIFLFLIFQGSVLGQEPITSVTGAVIDDQGIPLPGVNVIEKGESNGTITNLDGEFIIEVSADAILEFSFVGYAAIEYPVDGQSVLEIQMTPEASSLEEVIVVGYGTQKKSDLTGSVASVSSEALNEYPALDATQALQGRAAGVTVTSNNGEPGSGSRIRIRGGTSINAGSDPLYVVDGFAGATPPPPGDIASIEILKDASATAIYGSRGANGVVLVTTKSGVSGKTRIVLNTSYSFQQVNNRLDMLNGEQFAEYINEVYENDGVSSVPYPNPSSYGEGTDWQDQVLRSGQLQNYELSASGGKDDLNFYTSLNYFGQEGVVINSNYERISGMANLNFKPSDNINVGTKLLARRSERDGVMTQETAGTVGAIGGALKFEPTQGVYDDSGEYTRSEVGDPHDNPVAAVLERDNNSVNDLFQGNAFAEFSFLDDFLFKTSIGAQINNNRSGSYIGTGVIAGQNTGGSGSMSATKRTNLITENYLTYDKEFNSLHSLNVMGGYSYQSYRNESLGASNRNFISNGFSFWNLGGGSNFQSPSSSLTEWDLASFYGRVNYNLNDRYLFTVTGRYDGSSRFGINNKWAFFPSGAVGWNVGNENFMDFFRAMSHMKIRASYGVTGNTEIGSYRSLARFSSTGSMESIKGGSIVNAVRPTAVANKSLSWESTEQTDIGIDAGFFNNRLNFTADYYYKLTTDLLYDVPLPLYTGYSSSLQNIGSLENKGWEFSVNTINFDGNFSWRTDFNISFNDNEIVSLSGGDLFYNNVPGHMLATDSQVLREGEVVGAFHGWVFDRIYQEGDDFSAEPHKVPGDVKYVDINGDGVVNSDDRTIIGNPHADYTFGFRNEFSYKNFDLGIFIQGSQGNEMLNFMRMELEWMAGKTNATTAALDRWTPTNTNTDIPRASGSHSPEVNSRWVEDASYVRLKTLNLGYNFPESILNRLKVDNIRVYVSAQNILTYTDYSGYDPEVSFRDSNTNIGLDYAPYPNVESYTVGLNIGL